jgi:two-component SAPR family response regulator
MKILIVEDELIIAQDIKSNLIAEKHHVTGIVSSCQEALASIDKNKPDVIFMDIGLKGEIDGIQTAKIIFEKYNIRVIFLTSFFQKIPEVAHTIQPYAFIIKPVVQEEIIQTLKKINDEKNNIYSFDKSGVFYKETFYSKILNY